MNSKFIGITTLHVSGSLSAHHEFLAYIGIGTFYAVLMTVCYLFDGRLLPGAGWNWLTSSILLLDINLEFSGSVGFIHKE